LGGVKVKKFCFEKEHQMWEPAPKYPFQDFIERGRGFLKRQPGTPSWMYPNVELDPNGHLHRTTTFRPNKKIKLPEFQV
jgi:hypothetical protein